MTDRQTHRQIDRQHITDRQVKVNKKNPGKLLQIGKLRTNNQQTTSIIYLFVFVFKKNECESYVTSLWWYRTT